MQAVILSLHLHAWVVCAVVDVSREGGEELQRRREGGGGTWKEQIKTTFLLFFLSHPSKFFFSLFLFSFPCTFSFFHTLTEEEGKSTAFYSLKYRIERSRTCFTVSISYVLVLFLFLLPFCKHAIFPLFFFFEFGKWGRAREFKGERKEKTCSVLEWLISYAHFFPFSSLFVCFLPFLFLSSLGLLSIQFRLTALPRPCGSEPELFYFRSLSKEHGGLIYLEEFSCWKLCQRC